MVVVMPVFLPSPTINAPTPLASFFNAAVSLSGVEFYSTQLLSGTALAAGIGFVNLFGAVGGFIAPILRVKAETLFSSDAAGLLTLAAVAVIGSLIIFTLRVNRTVAQTDVAHH